MKKDGKSCVNTISGEYSKPSEAYRQCKINKTICGGVMRHCNSWKSYLLCGDPVETADSSCNGIVYIKPGSISL